MTDELVDAFARLVPQLSATKGPPGREALTEIVSSPAVTLLVARAEGTIVGSLTPVSYTHLTLPTTPYV